MRWFVVVITGLFLLGVAKTSAHEHWVDMDDFYPDAGVTGQVSICSGHRFPESTIPLKDRVLNNEQVITPHGEKASYATTTDGDRRSGKYAFQTNGVHIVGFELKQPQMKESIYWGKSIIVAGGADDEKLYCFDQGLEIIPTNKVSNLVKGDKLPLVVKYDGKRVKTRLSILPEQGRAISLSTTGNRPASLTISRAGRYLVTAGHDGKSCSLVFFVRHRKEDD